MKELEHVVNSRQTGWHLFTPRGKDSLELDQISVDNKQMTFAFI